jgi:hypothetical protein
MAKQNTMIFNFPWVKLDGEKSQQAIIDDPICLTALLMADDIYGEDKQPIKKTLNPLLVQRFNQAIFKKGRQIQMMAVDHSIAQYANPACFYSSAGNTQQATYYFEVLKDYLQEIAKSATFEIDEYGSISELLAELIDNTEQHGKSDYTRGISNKSVRSVVMNCHLVIKGQSVKSICGEDNPTANYINSIKAGDETLHLLEVSIFDSGPGIYNSFSNSEAQPSLDEEVAVVCRSFENGITSKPNGIGVGRGLNKARIILNERKGFLSLRSGRLSIYRDFQSRPLASAEMTNSPNVRFFDEITKTNTTFSAMKKVEGVSYTILVPLK